MMPRIQAEHDVGYPAGKERKGGNRMDQAKHRRPGDGHAAIVRLNGWLGISSELSVKRILPKTGWKSVLELRRDRLGLHHQMMVVRKGRKLQSVFADVLLEPN